MTQNFDDLIERVRQASAIEAIVAETPGFTVSGHGRFLTTREHDSLVIDTGVGAYHWNSRDEHGDVFRWIEKRNNWDFRSAVEYLCKRAGLAAPEWGSGSPSQRLAARARQDVFEVAASVFSSYLWADEVALQYARNRGWSDETIKAAKLGYAGNSDQRQKVKAELTAKLTEAGNDPQSPAAVALIGFNGDVRRWCKDHEIDEKAADKWIEGGYIPGMIGGDFMVYPHYVGGRVNYFSGRRVHFTDEDKAEGRRKSHNLPEALVGERQVYLNWMWSSNAGYCILVEGQANAVTLGQWGYPAAALMGVFVDEHLARMLGARSERNQTEFFLAIDADDAGLKIAGLQEGHHKPKTISENKFLAAFGPKLRYINWRGIPGIDTYIDLTDPNRPERTITDANDVMRGMML